MENQENQFGEFQQGLQRMVEAYANLRSQNYAESNVSQINIPYATQVETQNNQERSLRELQYALEGQVGTEQSMRSRIEQMIAEVNSQRTSEDEANRQHNIYNMCRAYARDFQNRLNRAVDLVRERDSTLLPIETRRFNRDSAIQALRELAARPICEESAIDQLREYRQEFDRIERTYLYDVHRLYRQWAQSHGLLIRRQFSSRGFMC